MTTLRHLTQISIVLCVAALIVGCGTDSDAPQLPPMPDLAPLPDWPQSDFYVPPTPDAGVPDLADPGNDLGGDTVSAPAPACNPGLPIAGTRFVKQGAGPLPLSLTPQTGAPVTQVPEGAGHPLEYRPAGDSGGFACVSYTSFTGYVAASQLTLAPPATGSSAGANCAAGMPSLGRRWVKAYAGQIPLHSVTNGGGSVIAQIPEGKDQWMDYLAVTAPGWVCVEWKGKVGHVSALLLSTSAPVTGGGCPTYDWVGSCKSNTVHWCEHGVEKSLACGGNTCGKNADGINVCKSSGASGSSKLGQGAACDGSGRTCQQDRSSCQLLSTDWLSTTCQSGFVCCKQKVSAGGCTYTHTGTCKGNTVHWCENGADQQLTCAGICGKNASGLYACLPASGGGGATGTPCGPASDGRSCQRLSDCKDSQIYPWQTACAWGYFCCHAK